MANPLYDFVGYTATQEGPGGARALNFGNIGGGTAQAAGALPSVVSAAAAPVRKGPIVPPVVWMFVFLIVGYIGLHMALKAV